MTPLGRKYVVTFGAILIAVGLCLAFPRLLAFAELGARQLRYFWWLVLLAAAGVYLAFFAGRTRK